jgi:hypothetical protein
MSTRQAKGQVIVITTPLADQGPVRVVEEQESAPAPRRPRHRTRLARRHGRPRLASGVYHRRDRVRAYTPVLAGIAARPCHRDHHR